MLVYPQLHYIFSPGWSFCEPYLALPQLKGCAKSMGIDLNISDFNILFYDFILNDCFFNRILEWALKKFYVLNLKEVLNEEEKILYLKLFKTKAYAPYLKEIDKYKHELKTIKNKKIYEKRSKILDAALITIGIYFEMDLENTFIKSIKYDENYFSEIFAFINDKNNIFTIFYEYALGQDIINEDVIGISITSKSQLLSSITLANIIKRKYPKKIILFGGNYITRLITSDIKQATLLPIFKYADIISLYEGEKFLYQIAQKGSMNNLLESILSFKDIAYCRNDTLIINTGEVEGYYLNDNMPDFDGFEMDKYLMPIFVLPILSSRNCYSNCAFCTIPFASRNHEYTVFNYHDIYLKMKKLSNKYKTKYFSFCDEVFSLRRLIEFSIYLKNFSYNFLWLCESRMDYILNVDECLSIREAGCKYIELGLESYNQRVIDMMKKNIDIENVDVIIDNMLAAGINLHLFNIFGFPSETIDELNKTKQFLLDFMKKSRELHHLYGCTIGYGTFGLEKGSDVYNNPEKYNLEVIDNNDYSLSIEHHYNVKKGVTEEEASFELKNFERVLPLNVKGFYPESLVLLEKEEFFIDSTAEFIYLELNKNPFTSENEKGYYYYKYSDGRVIKLSTEPSKFSKFEDSLFNFYMLDIPVGLDWKKEYIKNPYIVLDNKDFLCIDKITELKYKIDKFSFSLLKLSYEMGLKQAIRLILDEKVLQYKDIHENIELYFKLGFFMSMN